MGRKDDLKTDEDAINDSGFNEEEEHFELATEDLDYDVTIKDGTSTVRVVSLRSEQLACEFRKPVW